MTTRHDDRPAIIDGDIAKIPLGVNAKHGYALVDIDRADLSEGKWVVSNNGYVYNGKVLLHHLVMGKPPEGMQVDHINRDKKDNRIANLRFVVSKHNAFNRGKSIANTTGFVGVSRYKNNKTNPFVSFYSKTVNGKKSNHYIGCYPTAEAAAIARDKIIKELHGEYAYLNFPDLL